MKTAVTLLALVSAILADGPYHLARPGINYQQPQPLQQPLQLQQQQVQLPQQQIGVQNLQPGLIQANQPIIQYPQQNFVQGYNYPQPIAPTIVQQRPVIVQSFPQHQFTVNQPQQIAYQQANQLRQVAQQVSVQPAPILNNVQQSRFLGQQIANRYPQQGYNYPLMQVQTAIPTGYATQAPQQVNPNAVTSSLHSPDTRVYSSSSSAAADPLDETVVDRIQNILAENEITTANDAGYISLVSGVALEGARPSVEISSFVHNSPLRTNGQTNLRSLQDLARGNSVGIVGNIQGVRNQGNYAIPFAGGNGQIVNQNFLPQTHPAYGLRQ